MAPAAKSAVDIKQLRAQISSLQSSIDSLQRQAQYPQEASATLQQSMAASFGRGYNGGARGGNWRGRGGRGRGYSTSSSSSQSEEDQDFSRLSQKSRDVPTSRGVAADDPNSFAAAGRSSVLPSPETLGVAATVEVAARPWLTTMQGGIAVIEVTNISRSKITVSSKTALSFVEPPSHIAAVTAVTAEKWHAGPWSMETTQTAERLERCDHMSSGKPLEVRSGEQAPTHYSFKGRRAYGVFKGPKLPPIDLEKVISDVPQEMKGEYVGLLGEFGDLWSRGRFDLGELKVGGKPYEVTIPAETSVPIRWQQDRIPYH
uniref:Uncharacterized protein n=1 Tax=Chromera velia CCMP2878 TaxID=1169474 RepID=A0A0G4HZ30_9ALVE|eukprot:Cvel_9634.t1-p1 / transcript=Cvel_9634.t1 / gene=Cvel_9634 / organism=Chromera_velia_CCMP2878 / gene_product=hypothetical protein / transcript_product=hypothetical protein / location=Cvel_scaffold560:31070-32857(-) / protein_length=315 / sequence_SO=supercontig / SO=protein_coding / is_pseudo=false